MLHTSHVFSLVQSQLALCTFFIHYSHRLQLVLATCRCMLVVGLPVPVGGADGLEWSWLTETDTSIVVPFVAVVVVVAFVAVDAGCWSLHVFYASWFRNLPPHLNLHFLFYSITFVIRLFFEQNELLNFKVHICTYHFTQFSRSVFMNKFSFVLLFLYRTDLLHTQPSVQQGFIFAISFKLQFLWRGAQLLLRTLKPIAQQSGAQLIWAAKLSLRHGNWRIHFYLLCQRLRIYHISQWRPIGFACRAMTTLHQLSLLRIKVSFQTKDESITRVYGILRKGERTHLGVWEQLLSSTAKTDPDPGGFVKMMPVEQQG